MMSRELEQAADFIRESVSTESASNPLASIRFSERLVRHDQRRKRNRRIAAVGATSVLAAGALVAAAALQPRALTYRVDSSGELGALGTYMSAPAQAPLGIRFSEGSRVILQPQARGRVAQTSHRGATMVLEDGRAHAEIVHRDKTEWRVLAGPFVVGVTGTTFDVGFDVETQTFELTMQSGKVRVTGPGLKEPVEVRDAQRLVLSAKGGAVLPKPIDAKPATEASRQTETAPLEGSAREPQDGTPATRCSASAGSTEIAPPQRHAAKPDSETESFSSLGARGQHQKIVELAEKQGFDGTVASANRADLMALGNAARFAGRANLASMAYRAVRSRFANSAEAAAAAFFLGRISETGSSVQAIGWYERYMAEAPNGVWVADALGRRMAILNETQSGPLAQTAAKEYLNRFPTGPYAGFARKILAP